MEQNIVGLLKDLERQGVTLALNGQGQLVSQSAKEAVTPAIGQRIREQRDAIVRCLTARQAFERPIEPQGLDEGPLSSSQSGLWFIEQYEERSHLYNMPVYFRLTGELDVEALDFAFDAVIARHASLRTVFLRDEQGRARQRILPHRPFRLERVDLSVLPPEAREQAVAEQVRREIERPFDIERGALTRVRLLRLGRREHLLMITQHHIVSDGWSVKNLFADLKTAFLAHQNRTPLTWGEPALNYIDYASWFNSPRFRDYHDEFRPFWLERLAGIPEVHSLPLDKPRPAQPVSDGALVFSDIAQPLWEAFKCLCQAHNTSPFIGLHALFALLIARHSGERDVVIGTPLAYRERPEIESLIGFFVNTLVLRTQLPERQAFTAYLQQCRQDDLAAFDHQLYRFETLGETLGLDRHTAINPVFQIMLVYQAKVDFNDLIPGCDAVEQTSPVLPAKTDLSVKVTELSDRVRVDWLYATALFEHATVQGYADRFLRLLEAVVRAPETDIWRLPLLDPPMLQATERALRSLPTTYPVGQGALELFEQIARREPDAPALETDTGTLSYAELDARANRLAHWLREQGCGPDTPVGVVARRENGFALALLAVWKLGAAYVPLDPAYPAERLRHIAGDSGIGWLLGRGSAPDLLAGLGRWVDLDAPSLAASLSLMPTTAPPRPHGPDRLAQVIYTSGSSGRPKGVMIEQGALANLFIDHARRMEIGRGARMLCAMSLSFDAGNLCALLPLTQGACLLWGEPGEGLVERLELSAATHAILPTALLAGLPQRPLPALRAVGFGGEACPPGLVERWGGQFRLINMYGPTEATVTALCKTLEPGGPVTIGRPIDHVHALVLDETGTLCPVGVPGELCLAGVGLARGYLNQPERTAQVFREHRIGDVAVHLYHTGDRARLRLDGEFDYLGRLDEQIKLRGYRIEPGEVEAQLLAACPALEQVRVRIAGEGRRQRLVAYATCRAGGVPPEPDVVLQAAGGVLPEYMVPARLLLLERLPLTPNGKLDPARLPSLELDDEARVPPRGVLETEVLAIWEAVLEQPLGVEDDFFRLGGDSILSIQLATRLRDAGLACTVKEVFEAKTVRRLCRMLSNRDAAVPVDAEQGELSGEFPLQPIQRWFFEQPFDTPQHWNQGVVLRLPEGLDRPRLIDRMERLLAHHDALRLLVNPAGQRYLETDELTVPPPAYLDAEALGDQGLQDRLTDLQAHLDPASGRTLAWAVIERLNGGRALFIAFHHLVIDAVSWRILIDDLGRLHRGEPLPAKTSSFRQWGTALAGYAAQAREQLPYWQAQTEGMRCAVPADWRATNVVPPGLLELDAATSGRVLAAARASDVDVRTLLIAALSRSLQEMGLGRRQWIMLEGHGREAISAEVDVSRTVGWFTSMFPLQVEHQPSWPGLIEQVAAQLAAVPDKGIGYLALRTERAGASLPLPAVALNYLGSYRAGEGDWQPLPIAPGRPSAADNASAELISLHGALYDGRLTLRQIGHLRGDLSERLLSLLDANLRALCDATLGLSEPRRAREVPA